MIPCIQDRDHQIAAISDPEADGSIGNVVAANAIGVFLGLGFPWLVAAIYWERVPFPCHHYYHYTSYSASEAWMLIADTDHTKNVNRACHF